MHVILNNLHRMVLQPEVSAAFPLPVFSEVFVKLLPEARERRFELCVQRRLHYRSPREESILLQCASAGIPVVLSRSTCYSRPGFLPKLRQPQSRTTVVNG